MAHKYLASITLMITSMISFSHSQAVHNITVGYSDTLEITKEATNIICFGFEADHPNNHCKSEYVDTEAMWDDLMSNKIQMALMSEEVLIANQKKHPQPTIIAPLYQQYLILIGSSDVSMQSVQSFRDRTIGVTDWATKEHRGKPLSLALGLKERDVYFPITNTREQLADLFCSFAIDGIMIMSSPSSALARELTTSCDGQIMSFTQQQIQQVMKSSLGLYPGTIPKGMYWRVKEDINTLRSRIFLVVNPDPALVTTLVNSLDHIKDEIDLTTLRTNITPQSVIETYDINPIPLHPAGKNLIEAFRADQTTTKPQIARSSDESPNENSALPH